MNDFFDISILEKKAHRPEKAGPASTGPRQSILDREIVLFKKPFPDKSRESFYTEMASLLEAGLDMKACLQLLADEQTQKGQKAIIEGILARIIQGSSLSDSLQAGKHFTPYEYFTVQIGEESGRLPVVLRQLGTYYKKKIAQQRQVIGALTYPAIVLSVAGAAIFFMLNYVVPMFSDVFRRFGGDLPWLTKCVLKASNLLRQTLVWWLLLAAGLVLGGYINRQKDWFRRYSSGFVLRIPFVKDMIVKAYMARFAGTMALLTGARVPLLQAIQLTRKMLAFYPLNHALQQVEAGIIRGVPLHTCLDAIPLVPRKLVTMVKVGEEVNQLDVFFQKIADQYAEDLEHQSAMLGKFIEPLIILLLGLIVGLILIAMYLPLFNMGDMVR